MRRLVSRSTFRTLFGAVLGASVALGITAVPAAAQAQEIQLTGPLAGAPAVRKLRLRREGRFEIAAGASFTLLDEYQRTIMPGLRLQYHLTDWFGLGVFGGFGFQYTTGLTDELQEKAVDNRQCAANPNSRECVLTGVNLTRGNMADDQLGAMQWMVAPQLTFIPFRGKLSLFASLFVDTDVHFFVGPAIIGLKERKDCGFEEDSPGSALDPCTGSYELASRVTVAPTFGLGLNFYPSQFIGFGAEWRGLPFSWNTSGFDVAGGGADQEFPDTAVNGSDRQFRFNSMVTVNVTLQLPTQLKSTD
ncbi:MAG: hypothetical protein WKG00_29625 [Polyangiaceae bacterium]